MNRLILLARAEKNGEPIHPGLKDCIMICPFCGGEATFTNNDGDIEGCCEDCDDSGYLTNPDPMALIAAAQKQGDGLEWQVHFIVEGCVGIWHGDRYIGWSQQQPSNQVAFKKAMVQATEALEPDNWAKCKKNDCDCLAHCHRMIPTVSWCHAECTNCDGTGIVLLEAQDAQV